MSYNLLTRNRPTSTTIKKALWHFCLKLGSSLANSLQTSRTNTNSLHWYTLHVATLLSDVFGDIFSTIVLEKLLLHFYRVMDQEHTSKSIVNMPSYSSNNNIKMPSTPLAPLTTPLSSNLAPTTSKHFSPPSSTPHCPLVSCFLFVCLCLM